MSCSAVVALRKESVDRNIRTCANGSICVMSLSARRAWIELSFWYSSRIIMSVALRKESVDRNKLNLPLQICGPESLSARRAWIEMF